MMTITVAEQFMTTELESYERDLEHYAYSLPTQAVEFGCTDELMRAVTASGSQMFTPESMRWWKSRVDGQLTAGRFLVTSDSAFGLRQSSVRWVYTTPESRQLQMASFDQKFATPAKARAFARRAAAALFSE